MTRSNGSKGKFQPITHILLAAGIGVALGAGASFAQNQDRTPVQVAQAKTVQEAQAKSVADPAHGHPGERHPALHRALRDLERAKVALEKAPASDSVGGHKEAALKLVDQAIAEINAGLFPSKK